MNPRFRALHQDGFALWPAALGFDDCLSVLRELGQVPEGHAGTRNLLLVPWCRALGQHLLAALQAQGVVGDDMVAVQCTHFEKHVGGANWLVSPHQDLSVPVAERADQPGWSGWSRKESKWYVQPPAAFLERVLAVRVHLDPCDEADGPLRVLPGSHTHGILSPERIAAQPGAWRTCTASVGDALLMRPLLVHASSKATGDSRRRVLHWVFAPRDLPAGLRWLSHTRAQGVDNLMQ
jgi:hypothetical protein